jgi:hypothetical protein
LGWRIQGHILAKRSLDEDPGRDSPGRVEPLCCVESELGVYLDEARPKLRTRVYAT